MMKHQQGIPREQLQMLSFDTMISAENSVRFIDSFVEHLDLSKLKFQVQVQKQEGRPSFERKVNEEHSLIMLVYNIKRTINILGMPDLLEKLKNWTPNYDKIARLRLIWTHYKPNYDLLFYTPTLAA